MKPRLRPEAQIQIGEHVLYLKENVYATVDGYLWIKDVGLLPRIGGYRLSCGIIVPRESIVRVKIWIQTLAGGFDLLEPRAEQVDFESLSVALSRIPRFLGYTVGGPPLSVAQHCVEGARAIERETRRRDAAAAFLLHDAHEAFIGDIPTPVQRALEAYSSEVRAAIRALKDRIDAAIYDAAGVEWPLDDETQDIVRTFDLRMCRTERDLFCLPPWQRWEDAIENAVPVDGISREIWSAPVAKWEYSAALKQQFVDNPSLVR